MKKPQKVTAKPVSKKGAPVEKTEKKAAPKKAVTKKAPPKKVEPVEKTEKKAAPKKAVTKKAPPKKVEPDKKAKKGAAKAVSVSFEIQAEPKSKVFVVGSFNGWNDTQHPLKGNKAGLFSTKIKLENGRYEYKYVINNEWVIDPAQESVWNDQGSQNNVLYVG